MVDIRDELINVGAVSDQENRPRQNTKKQKHYRGFLAGVSMSQAAAHLGTYTEPSEESLPSTNEAMRADEIITDDYQLLGRNRQLHEPSNNATGGSS